MDGGKNTKLNLRNPKQLLDWILSESRNFLLVIIESSAVGIHTIAVDSRPSRRIILDSAKKYALKLCQESIILCGGDCDLSFVRSIRVIKSSV